MQKFEACPSKFAIQSALVPVSRRNFLTFTKIELHSHCCYRWERWCNGNVDIKCCTLWSSFPWRNLKYITIYFADILISAQSLVTARLLVTLHAVYPSWHSRLLGDILWLEGDLLSMLGSDRWDTKLAALQLNWWKRQETRRSLISIFRRPLRLDLDVLAIYTRQRCPHCVLYKGNVFETEQFATKII